MLQASAAFKGRDIQNFWEGGRTLNRGTLHFMGRLDNPLETMLYHFNPRLIMFFYFGFKVFESSMYV